MSKDGPYPIEEVLARAVLEAFFDSPNGFKDMQANAGRRRSVEAMRKVLTKYTAEELATLKPNASF